MADIVIAEEPADSDAVRWCFGQYYAELGRLFGYVVDEEAARGRRLGSRLLVALRAQPPRRASRSRDWKRTRR